MTTDPPVKRVAVYGGAFNPPGSHHRKIAEELRRRFDEVIVVPCGPRPDKPTDGDPVYRAAMADLAFSGIDGVEVDLFDLEQATFTRTHDLDRRYACRGEVWHVVGSDLVMGGRTESSFIHKSWQHGPRVWRELNFAVLTRRGHECGPADLPPRYKLVKVAHHGSSFEMRDKLFKQQSIEKLADEKVLNFLTRHRLYRGAAPRRANRWVLPKDLRVLLSYDQRNAKAAEWARQFKRWEDPNDPHLIIVIGGDGTMLHAIQQHWRRRIPFYGINAGHLGFLLNRPDEALGKKFPPEELVTRHMPLLYVEMQRRDGSIVNELTFNDAWVERLTGQSAWVEVKIDGKARLPKLVCDGVLISTAAGSTAYARSMGATPLLADTPAWLLVGSNVMHPMHWKSALLGLEGRVEIRNLDPDKRPLNGFMYGVPVGEVVSMTARVSRIAAVELAFVPTHDLTEKIAQIQFPNGETFAGL